MKKPLPSQARLRELLDYDPLTGGLVWKLSPANNIPAGSPVGGQGSSNNRTARIDGGRYPTQRLIWKLVTGDDPPHLVDHKNGNFTDNSWENLRLATHSQNNANKRLKSSTSGLPKGVFRSRSGRRYGASVKFSGVSHFLGYFDTPDEAHQAYRKAAIDLHGEFAAV